MTVHNYNNNNRWDYYKIPSIIISFNSKKFFYNIREILKFTLIIRRYRFRIDILTDYL